MYILDMEQVTPQNWNYNVSSQLRTHVYCREEAALAMGDAARDAIENIQQLDARRTEFRARLIENLGGLPPSDTPLNARIVGKVDCDGFTIEKVIFESRPGAFVTANLYIPNGITSPRGTVLFLSGHSPQAKQFPPYQTVCQCLVKAGLIVMSQDPVGQGERFGYYEQSLRRCTVGCGTTEHDYVGWQCLGLGDCIARYFIHDAMRGIDYLLTRPEVDAAHIGVTGCSGGGTQTGLMMICDQRIAAAAPTTYITNRRTYMHAGLGQDQEQIWPGLTALGFDHEDVVMMMAPRPVQVQAVTYDFNPIEGTRRTVTRCKRFWEMYGKADCLSLVEDDSVHMYTRPLANAAARFFAHHLLGRDCTPEDYDINILEPNQIWCTKSGQVRGEITDARFVYDENQDRLARLKSESNNLNKEHALAWLKDKVIDCRQKCDLNPRFYFTEHISELEVKGCFWWSQPDIIGFGLCFRDFAHADESLPVTIALWDEGSNNLRWHIDWIRKTCAQGRAVLVLNVTGMGAIKSDALNTRLLQATFATIHKLTTELIRLGDSLAAIRIYDILRALDVIGIWPNLQADDIRIYTHGRYDIYARIASALDKRIGGIESIDGMGSYADWVGSRYYNEHDIAGFVMPGILRNVDESVLASG
ncbi:hypothetical protein LLG46_02830 [bacterium]|nr:hypothetical protein [bacterium]